MTYVVDTHALVWFIEGNSTKDTIIISKDADIANSGLVSVVW